MVDLKAKPKLRFSKFSKPWNIKYLSDVAKITSGGTPNRGKANYWDGTIPWITTSLIDFKDINYAEEFITEDGLNNSSAKLFEKGTILMAMYGQGKTRGKVGLLSIDASTNQACAAFITKETIYSRFLFYSLAGYYKRIRSLSNEGGQKNLSIGLLKTYKLFIPDCIDEQQKIASFLLSIDKKIKSLQEKKDLLKQYKKGVMQQIFSQQIRFKDDDGNDYPDWKEKALDTIAVIYQPKTISQNQLTEDGYSVYGANGIIGKYKSYNHEFSQIAVTCRGNTCGTVNFTEPKSWITGNAMVINLDSQKEVKKTYLYHLLSNTNFGYLITGSGQPQITGDIKKHKVLIPTILEQSKIADFLSAIDDKIELVDSQIVNTQEFKKGLLQQMFV